VELRVTKCVEADLVKLSVAIFVDGEYVIEPCLCAEADVHVVAEEEAVAADRDDVSRGAVVLRRQPLRGEQRGGDGAEDLLPGGIQLVEARPKLRAMGGEPRAEDFVSALIEHRCGSVSHERCAVGAEDWVWVG
jgi:hypothetical protein